MIFVQCITYKHVNEIADNGDHTVCKDVEEAQELPINSQAKF